MKKQLLFLFVLFFILSCNSDNNEVKDFENVFELTKQNAVEFGLPVTQFKISYPKDVTVILPKKNVYNPNYIEFYCKDDEVFLESLSIGFYESASIANDFQNQALLDQLLGQFTSQIPDIEVIFNGKAKFGDKELYQLQLKFEIVDEMYGELGKYKMLFVLYPPDIDLQNGVLLMFQATDNSDIKEFTDFGEKGKTAEIWQTFRFY